MKKTTVYGFEMARISEVYLSTLSSIMKPHGLRRWFRPLIHLCEHSGKLTQKDLALALKIDKVSALRMVDYLSDRDLVIRKRDRNDRRCLILEVTDKAKALLPKVKQAVEQTNDLLLHDFTELEKEIFMTSMEKLFITISSMPEPDFIVKAVKRKVKNADYKNNEI